MVESTVGGIGPDAGRQAKVKTVVTPGHSGRLPDSTPPVLTPLIVALTVPEGQTQVRVVQPPFGTMGSVGVRVAEPALANEQEAFVPPLEPLHCHK